MRYTSSQSAQPCGCDPGCKPAPHVCEWHQSLIVDGRKLLPLLMKEGSLGQEQNKGSVAATMGIGGAPTRATTLPVGGAERKQYPVASGVLDYFPDAIAAIAYVSHQGNKQHNPGQPLHWARGKSADEADTMQRHFLQRGSRDTDGIRHSAKMAWRALALLQKEIEAEQQQLSVNQCGAETKASTQNEYDKRYAERRLQEAAAMQKAEHYRQMKPTPAAPSYSGENDIAAFIICVERERY